MNKAFLETLYETSISFKIFVDRNCQTYGWTKERCFKDKIVQSYANYVVKDQDSYAKEDAKREYRQNYGC